MPSSLASDFRLLETLWRDAPTRTFLSNGLTLVMKPDAAATVASVQAWVKTGSIHEGSHLGAGLSHYLEHLLFKGTARRLGRQIAAEVQAHGGYINAYTSFDRTVYYIDMPAEHAGVAVDILGDTLLHSTLPAAEVAREKDVILREIDMGLDDPDQRLWQQLFETVFQQHPMRQPIIGHREVFAAIERPELLDYYRARYVPNNIVMVITGGFDPTAMHQTVTTHFGSVPRRRLAPVYLPAEPAALSPRVEHSEGDVEIVRATIAWPIPGLNHPDAPALTVLSLILGHGDSSVLWKSLREKARWVHSIDATSWAPGAQGLFYVYFVCDAGQRDRALAGVHRELRKLRQRGFKLPQIRQAVRQMVVGEVNGRKTAAGQASRLGIAEVVAGDLGFSRAYFERLRRVTPAALTRVLTAYLLEGVPHTVSLSPRSEKPVVSAGPRAPDTPEIKSTTLPNGARLILQQDDRLPNLHVRLLSLGGPAYEAVDQRGATQLMATLLARDTAKRTAAQVAAAIEAVGGSLSPITGNNTLGLAVEVLPGDVELALDLLAEAALQPKFTPTSFAIERDAQIAELQQDADDLVTIARQELRRRFFGNHPLSVEAGGVIADLRRLKPRDLRRLHRDLLVAPNVVLSVAGDFSPGVLEPRLRRFLKRFRPAEFKVAAPPLAQPAAPADFVVNLPRQQAVVMQGYPGPGVQSPDYHVAEVADEIFSGMSSRLFERVREEKGLAYYVRSSRVVGLGTGMFYFYAGTAPGQENAVLREIELEIKRMAAGKITRAELQRCQTRLIAARRMSLQSNSAKAMYPALHALYGQPLDGAAEFEKQIGSVTVKSLAVFAKTYLRRRACTQVIVRP